MDSKRVEDKIDKIMEDISDIKVTMARNTDSLEIHIKRTNLLEQKIEPIEKHVITIQATFKVLVIIGGLIAGIAGVIEAISSVLH